MATHPRRPSCIYVPHKYLGAKFDNTPNILYSLKTLIQVITMDKKLNADSVKAITASISTDIKYRNHIVRRGAKGYMEDWNNGEFALEDGDPEELHLEQAQAYIDEIVDDLTIKTYKNLKKILMDDHALSLAHQCLPKEVVHQLQTAWLFFHADHLERTENEH